MSTSRSPLLVVPLLAALALAACSSSTASGPPGSSGDPSDGPPSDGADHPTGATDVVLQYDEGGGLMLVDHAVTAAPIFTLYGDGTVLYRPVLRDPPPLEGSVTRGHQFRIARLDAEQVNNLIEFALGPGGLGVARAKYDPGTIADAPTSTFVLRGGGVDKRVEVVALGPDMHPPADTPVITALTALAERLRDFDEGGTVPMEAWSPDRYRGVFWEAGGAAGDVRPWPWDDIAPGDFVQVDDPQAGFGFPRRTLTPDEVAALGLENVEGGLGGVFLRAADGTILSFALRPLLPDEER